MSIYSRIYSNLCSKGKLLKEQHRKGRGVDPGHFAVGVDEHGVAHINRGTKK